MCASPATSTNVIPTPRGCDSALAGSRSGPWELFRGAWVPTYSRERPAGRPRRRDDVGEVGGTRDAHTAPDRYRMHQMSKDTSAIHIVENALILLRHECPPRVLSLLGAWQQGHRGRCLVMPTMSRCRKVAIEVGTLRSGLSG